MYGPRLHTGKRYQVKLVYKTTNIAGPRVSGQPYGFVIKTMDHPWGQDGTPDQFDAVARNASRIVNHDTTNHDWQTVNLTYTAEGERTHLYVYLDNVTAGQVYIDEFSMREILSDGTLGGEVIRNPRADMHTYVEQRPAAFTDWQVEQGEKNNVYFKYVVHDKNDWIQNHLLSTGQWADQGNGYYQDENTKARWLLRQWYRYLTARWGYSTAIHTWELNNEGPPNAEQAGTAAHWRTAQAFAKYIHETDAHRHLATTSFWCCWRPEFWGNTTSFPDIDYADLHMYTDNIESGVVPDDSLDLAMWTYRTSLYTYNTGYPSGQKGVGKPIVRQETGIATNNPAFNLLKQQNPGIWFHNLLWAQLNVGAMYEVGYWWAEHFAVINEAQVSKPFYQFVKDLDLNKGGYVDAAGTASNTKLRIFGQKNTSKNKAHLWIQNADHTWKKVMDGVTSSQTGTVTIRMNPNIQYTAVWWDTYAGTVKSTQTMNSNSSGDLVLQVSNLSDDVSIKISSGTSVTPTPTPTADQNNDRKINMFDAVYLFVNFNSTTYPKGDLNNSGRIDAGDIVQVLQSW
jgi:hypothetical protein